jgi:sensor histidine kinase regulating citrate/malate metabolism
LITLLKQVELIFMKTREAILQFLNNGVIVETDSFFYCQTRDQSASRLSRWIQEFQQLGISSQDSAVLTAIIGELTNNCFDHNLGQWHNPSGCVVGFETNAELVAVTIADRGQGIVASLNKALRSALPAQEILKKAFEERISGRAPEKRGNGLKFVLRHLGNNQGSLLCCSQGAMYSFGQPNKGIITSELPHEFGTLIYLEWRRK